MELTLHVRLGWLQLDSGLLVLGPFELFYLFLPPQLPCMLYVAMIPVMASLLGHHYDHHHHHHHHHHQGALNPSSFPASQHGIVSRSKAALECHQALFMFSHVDGGVKFIEFPCILRCFVKMPLESLDT